MLPLDGMEKTARKRLFALPAALHYPAYRMFWMGSLASVSGFQVLLFSLLWQAHELTGSPLFLGSVGAATAVPSILLNLYGGAFADKMNKRRLITTTQITIAFLIFFLATVTLLDLVQPWHVLAIALATGAVNAFDQPARMALYPMLVERKAMMSAVTLNSAIWQGSRMPAPALAGLIIAKGGTESALFVAGAGFLIMAAVIYRLQIQPIARRGGSTTQELLEGIKFIKTHSTFSLLIGMSFFNSFFGMAYVMLMPVFAVDLLELGPDGAGILLGIGGLGAILANLWLASRGNIDYRGLLVIGGATMAGLSVATFALTSYYVGSYYLAMVLMLVTGAFNSVYMISVVSSLQIMVPDHMRGRVMGFYGMTYSIMPLGGFQAGAIASVIGTPLGAPIAIAIGGLAVSSFAIGTAIANKRVRGLDSELLKHEEDGARWPDTGRNQHLSPR